VIQRLPLLTLSNSKAEGPSDEADRRNGDPCSRWRTCALRGRQRSYDDPGLTEPSPVRYSAGLR